MATTLVPGATGDVNAGRLDANERRGRVLLEGRALSRRDALIGALMVLAGTPLGTSSGPWPHAAWAGTLPLDRQRFLELSAKLCDLPIKARGVADEIQAAIAGGTQLERINRLAALVGPAAPETVESLVAASDLGDLAESLIAAWYTGMTGSREELGPTEIRRVVTHEDALAWRATGYAKAPGTCGVFAEWAANPGLVTTINETTGGGSTAGKATAGDKQ